MNVLNRPLVPLLFQAIRDYLRDNAIGMYIFQLIKEPTNYLPNWK